MHSVTVVTGAQSSTGLVFNIQRFALHDGPGIRTTVFLKGCPAHCLWCHNPESQRPSPELVHFPERCVSCGTCRTVCPNGLLPERCTACGTCASQCPADARQLVGRRMSVGEVMAEVSADRMFQEGSGGGVTVSGGEPLMQPAFLHAFLAAAKAAGFSTSVDTCGAGSRRALVAIAPLVDVFLYDLKIVDEARHIELTGVPLGLVLANLRALSAVHDNIWIRIPVVPGYTDDERSLERAADICAGTAAIRRVHLLPYHRTGAGKFARLGQAYPLADVTPPPAARIDALASIFRARGLDTRIGG